MKSRFRVWESRTSVMFVLDTESGDWWRAAWCQISSTMKQRMSFKLFRRISLVSMSLTG